jgi:NAD(P)-dependent dehydrogenase (short-subunit alcohol dehydrogenase family)
MKSRFMDQVVLVTGGNSGIGLATAKAFANEGAKVVITGRNPESLEVARKEIGHGALAFKTDVSKTAELDTLFGEIKKNFGHLDVVFVNAGVPSTGAIKDVTEKDFDDVMNVNLKGAFFTAQKAILLMPKGGRIIFNSSVLGSKGVPGMNVYSASKAAIRSFARSFSAEFIGQGIRTNVVSPGPIETPIWTRNANVPNDPMLSRMESRSQQVPMKRFGRPEEVASAVLFLASEESSYILGNELFVDGGIGQL